MKTLAIILGFVSLEGLWQINETIYSFSDELLIFEDGHADAYSYDLDADTIHLDYGSPFKIELLTRDSLALSKRFDGNYLVYGFSRIRR